jgi:hypothetical protein
LDNAEVVRQSRGWNKIEVSIIVQQKWHLKWRACESWRNLHSDKQILAGVATVGTNSSRLTSSEN